VDIFKKSKFSKVEEQQILNAIRRAEEQTTGEIRILITNSFGKFEPLEFARKKFFELGMYKTQHRNAVLFVICLNEKKLAVWADEAIYQKAGDEFWNQEVDIIISGFKNHKGVEGICKAIEKCGLFLKKHFPVSPDNQNPNELSDEVHYEN
jgi:uncharacterized membrane protein